MSERLSSIVSFAISSGDYSKKQDSFIQTTPQQGSENGQ